MNSSARPTLIARQARFIIAAALLFVATPVAPRAQSVGDGRITRYLIVSGDSSSGSWDSSDQPRIQQWRSQYGSHFAWFRMEGADYLVTDQSTLEQIDDALAPQRSVNHQQGTVNQHQGEVNRMQSEVNAHQRDVNRAQTEVNRRQTLVNRGGGDQSDVNRMQSDVNARQHDVNAEQKLVNREQEVVNREQSVVNEAQHRANAQIRAALQAIFDSARARGQAHQVR
ncbi:MAG TPA: hypothetical protein VEU96_08660 [Bryobacteraceae bacterium]|nr:hypothetical protein [Bryobacteraceae bacterium]